MSLAIDSPADPAEFSPTLQLNLLRGFELRCHDETADVPVNVQRLLAFLALSAHPQHRLKIAGTLWTESSEERAAANLRTALWRSRRIDEALVTCHGSYLELGPRVRVDLVDAVERARRLVSDPTQCVVDDTPALFGVGELLPEWYEDWVQFERERLRQLLLHSLEALCLEFSRLGRHGLAVEAGIAAVAAEPLRESAHRALIRAHCDEGNIAEAVRQYDLFAAILRESLDLEPSDALRALVSPCR